MPARWNAEGWAGKPLRVGFRAEMLTEINAARAALHMVEELLLRDRVSHGVADAFAMGAAIEQRHKIKELISTVRRMTR